MAYGLISAQSQILPPLGNPATPSEMLSGTQLYNADKEIVTGTMINQGNFNRTITTQNGSYTIPRGYHSGSGRITASFSNLTAENVKSGVNIGGVVGSLQGINSSTITININSNMLRGPNNTIAAYFVNPVSSRSVSDSASQLGIGSFNFTSYIGAPLMIYSYSNSSSVSGVIEIGSYSAAYGYLYNIYKINSENVNIIFT